MSETFRNWNIESYATNINVPLLAIQGVDDQYGTMKQIDILEKKIKSKFSKLILEKCRHSPHKEYPDLVLKKIEQFLLND